MQVTVKRKLGALNLDVSFTGSPGGVTALFGHSGAGKTSVINMVAGLLRPDEGRIILGGRCLFDAERGIDLPPEKRRIGYVFQEGRLFPHLTVRANLAYGMRLVPVAERKNLDKHNILPDAAASDTSLSDKIFFDEVVALLGLEPLLERRPRLLSGGEKQRVAIGRALLTSPRALLMDEPLASLDAERKQELLPYVARISREFSMPILYVSHVLEEINQLTQQVVFMRNGQVVC